MKLSISNIAWDSRQDELMYGELQKRGFVGLEIAPTRIFPEHPYEHLKEAGEFRERIKSQYGLCVSSMQSIWFGRSEKLFSGAAEREELFAYTKRAIDFAEAVGCKNLVFGSPKNRHTGGREPKEVKEIASDFFGALGRYAGAHATCLSLEPNPAIYETDFMNGSEQALAFVKETGEEGLRVNLDFGTIIANGEKPGFLTPETINYVNHIHISEPYLAKVKKRAEHEVLAHLLRELDYKNYVSIEMGSLDDMGEVCEVMDYVKEVFAPCSIAI